MGPFSVNGWRRHFNPNRPSGKDQRAIFCNLCVRIENAPLEWRLRRCEGVPERRFEFLAATLAKMIESLSAVKFGR